MARRDYYNILGVKRTASPDEIKRAFRALALKYHPDRNPDDVEAERRFLEIAEAWEVLGDPEERSRYDRLGPFYKSNGQPPTPDELQEFLSEAIGGFFGRKGPNEPGEDLRYTLKVTLEEVAQGAERTIEVPRQVNCRSCEGSGAHPEGGRKECEACSGSGRSPTRRLFRQRCARCDGRGYVVVRKCERCSGGGRHGSEDRLKVKVPPGVATGQKLKLRGKGNEGRGDGAPGDLLVIVNVDEHPLFRRRGDDLIVDLPLTFSEATAGAGISVPTLEGCTRIRIPAGTPSGKILRLTGRGLPRAGKKTRGDLHLKVEIEIPPSLTAAQRDALLAFAELTGPAAHPLRRAFDEKVAARS